MAKENCWEFKKCGKEKDCPAYPYQGTMCYAAKATLCRGEIQGGYEDKIKACRTTCDYYKHLMSSK
jgi:hypothetical protein